jgi:hypothetical protein
MALPTDVLKAWEACDRTDTLFVLVCSVFCTPTPYCLLSSTSENNTDYREV